MRRKGWLLALVALASACAAQTARADMDCEPLRGQGKYYLDCTGSDGSAMCYRCPRPNNGGNVSDCRRIDCGDLPTGR